MPGFEGENDEDNRPDEGLSSWADSCVGKRSRENEAPGEDDRCGFPEPRTDFYRYPAILAHVGRRYHARRAFGRPNAAFEDANCER
jgi:hypothetical protein